MNGQNVKLRRRRKANQQPIVTCVRCGEAMTLVRSEPMTTYGHQFERKVFHCSGCEHSQTYTMGTTR